MVTAMKHESQVNDLPLEDSIAERSPNEKDGNAEDRQDSMQYISSNEVFPKCPLFKHC